MKNYIKTVIVVVILLTIGFSFLALNKVPNNKFSSGVYMSFEELKSRKPTNHCHLVIEGRSEKNQFWWGGSDYKLTSPDKCISKGDINRQAWAYADDSDMYINCKKMQLEQYAYARVISSGRFLVFSNKTLKESIAQAVFWGGVVAGAIAQSSTNQPFDITLYSVDTRSARLFMVDSAYLERTLKDYPAIYSEFRKEFDKNDVKFHLKYLQMANNAE